MRKVRNAYLKVNYDNGVINPTYDMSADIEGVTRVERLVILDQKDGKEWELVIHDGKLIVEPYEKDEKRDFRIGKVIDEDK
jgi:hypothetical protein